MHEKMKKNFMLPHLLLLKRGAMESERVASLKFSYAGTTILDKSSTLLTISSISLIKNLKLVQSLVDKIIEIIQVIGTETIARLKILFT